MLGRLNDTVHMKDASKIMMKITTLMIKTGKIMVKVKALIVEANK